MMLRDNSVAVLYMCVVTIILMPNFITMKRIEKRQVHLENRIPTATQWYLSDTPVSMNVKSAWRDGYTGKGVLVAVVDDGVNRHHPDLRSNFNLTASYDFLEDQDIDTDHNPGDHGTSCAGIIAGADNAVCGVGVAFQAQISSVRILGDKTPSTEHLEAKALSFQRDMIDVYSNSWGPEDSGWDITRLGPRLKETLENGTRLGRHGKGSIFVFAAGNGGINGDSCAFNGYVNSIHTIAISGVNWDGSVPAYAEPCAAIMAVTYGQDVFANKKITPSLITAKGARDCTQWFPGSSSSTSFASGIIALALQANPGLTWRDVQHLIARSSKPLNPPFTRNVLQVNRRTPSWRKNKANLTVSNEFGFGLMDARSMIKYAKDWRPVPKQLSCEVKLDVSSSKSIIPSSGDLHLKLPVTQENCNIQYLEHMQVEVDLRFHRRGYLEMLSTSPSGTQSKLLYSRRMDIVFGEKNLINLRVTSLHYWGEKPTGDWKLTIGNTSPRSNVHPDCADTWGDVCKEHFEEGECEFPLIKHFCKMTCGSKKCRTGRVTGLKLILFGTKEDPLKNNPHVNRRPKEAETVDVSRRKTEYVTEGGYSRWSRWSLCSRTCGYGTQKRYRWCNNPPPKNGGRDFRRLGKATESRRCIRRRCPVNGRFSNWESWTECDVTCGQGYKQRMRTCTNPAPAHGGRYCVGEQMQRTKCELKPCPAEYVTEGGYSRWSRWSLCSRTCGHGTQTRYLLCNNPPPKNGGRDCRRLGKATESRGCNLRRCPDCILVGSRFWGLWTERDNSSNYYEADITKVNATHLEFALKINKAKTRSYKRTAQVLIIDEAVEIKDISVSSRVIAVHKYDMQEWYRTGTVTSVSSLQRFASVKFDDGQQRMVPLGQLRLVKRPIYCKDGV